MTKKPQRVVIAFMLGNKVIAESGGWKDFELTVGNNARRKAEEFLEKNPEYSWEDLKRAVVYP